MHIKQNPIPGSRSLACEVRGLEELRRSIGHHGLRVPRVISLERDQLVLEKIREVRPTAHHWRELGNGLAHLHRVTAARFGFDESNYIGLNEQKNDYCDDWAEFFIDRRLRFQIELIRDRNRRNQMEKWLKESTPRLKELLSAHHPQPSLVHGDLWSGNVLFSAEGPWLIDPAVYYGDREVDIAMTKMFGGFSDEFYEAYSAEWPLSPGYEDREKIYNLYHYLNHYNLFGESYWPGVV